MGRNVLAFRARAQLFVQQYGIVGGENAHRNLMRWRPFLAEVTERTCVDLVTPGARAQECPRQCAAHSSRIVLKVEAPQVLDIDCQGLIAIPSASDDHPSLNGRRVSVHMGGLGWIAI